MTGLADSAKNVMEDAVDWISRLGGSRPPPVGHGAPPDDLGAPPDGLRALSAGPAPVLEHREPCTVCGSEVPMCVATGAHPGSPELVQIGPGAWLGMVRHADGESLRVLACSDRCRSVLLEE